MFNAVNKQFVPSKTVSVKPENQTEYSCRKNNQIRFHIPSYIGFCDPEHIRFQAKAKMVCADGSEPRGMVHPDGAAGIWSTVRDLRISDGSGRTELEMISDLNVLCANEWQFTQNDSINAMRELFEGMSVNADPNHQLWFDAPTDWLNTDWTENPGAIQNKISARFPCSGIIGEKSTNVFPLTATSGLRVVMNLEDITRCMTLSNTIGAGEAKNYPGPSGVRPAAGQNYSDVGDSFYVPYTTKASGAGDSDVVDLTPGSSNNGIFTIELSLKADITAGANAAMSGFAACNAQTDNNFAIGDLIYICKLAGTDPNCLGKITKMEAGTGNRCKITYEANRPDGDSLATGGAVGGGGYIGTVAGGNAGDSVVFFLAEDRINRTVLAHTATARSEGSDVLAELDIEISDCELSILQVEPPAGYVDNMLKKVNGPGVEMDYCTATLYRGNIVNAQGMTSNLIPANQSRAYSLLSVPLTQDSQTSLIESSLLAKYEDQKNYQWVLNGNLVPDRPIDLSKYEFEKNPVLHIMENEKAMGNAKNKVRNLWSTADRLLFGRALSRYGQVHDLQGKTTMLRVTYPNTVGDTVLLNNNVVHLNRMVIQADGVVVIR